MAENTDTRQFAAEQVDKLLGKMAFQISRTLKSRNPDSVHDLRVAIRRFDQALAVYSPCFPGKDVKKIHRRLKAIMAPAGEVRNCDIAVKLLSKSKLPEAAALRTRFQSERKQAEQLLRSSLSRWLERKSSMKWRSKLRAGSAAANGDVCETVAELASKTLPSMAKEFFHRGQEAAGASGSAKELHQFRLAVKKFRYTAELFAPVYNSDMGLWLEQMRVVQTLLGDINDCFTVRNILARRDAGKAVDAELRKRQRRQIEQFRQRWTEEFSSGAMARRWVNYFRRFAGRPLMKRKPMARSSSAAPASRRATAAGASAYARQ